MLTKLVLENFKRHKSLTVNMTEGLNLITGPNYTGKSTLLQAIRYSFEGATAIPGGKAVSTLHGAKNHKVELSMRVNDHDYVITRTLTKATLTRDGEVVAKSASVVTNHLAELLGMSGQRFGQLRYGRQKETEALLTLGVTELHKIVGEVSRVEVVNEVITKCGTAASECTGGLAVLPAVDTATLEHDIDELTVTIAKAYDQLCDMVEEIDKKNAVLVELRAALTRVTALVQGVIAANKERERLDEDGHKLIAGIDAAKVKVQNLHGADERFASLQESLNQVMRGITDTSVQASQLTAKQRDYALLEGRLQATMVDAEKFAELLAEHDGFFDTEPLKHQVEEAFKEKAAAESRIMELQQSVASGVCPTCKRPYEEGLDVESIQRQISDLTTDLPTLARTYTRLNKELAACQTSNDSLRKTNERLVAAQETAHSQKTVLADLADELVALSEHDPVGVLSNLEAKANTLRAELAPAQEDAMALNTAKAELASLEKRIIEVETKRSELGPVEMVASTDKLTSEVMALEAEVMRLNTVYQPASTEYTRMTGELGAMQTSFNLARDTANKRTSLEGRLGTAKALSKYLRGNRDRFMGQVWDGIMGQASSFSSACTGGAIEQVSRGENGKFTFTEGGHELPVEAASGAQRSIMGLGVQLAMASLLPCPLTTIMLDEPGSDMDPERALSLTTLLAADHNQLLMVSHRELDGAVANNTIALERT